MSRKTVFVVGAGASVEFGFPTGPGLIRDVCAHLSERNNSYDIFGSDSCIASLMETTKQLGIHWDYMYKAGQKLASILRGNPVSIDNVIHSHSEDALLVAAAKTAIALTILQCENNSKLAFRSQVLLKDCTTAQDSWLHYMLMRHFAGYTTQDRKKSLQMLRFIVFNYDRCVEQVLRQTYACCFHLSDSDAISECNELSIIHPYGVLGELPPVAFGGEDGFGQKVTTTRVTAMSQRLRTFTEGIADAATHDGLAEAVKWSECIVFVGFGFLALNRQLICKGVVTNQSRMALGSAFGMPIESAKIRKQQVESDFDTVHAYGFDPRQDALNFLKEYEAILFK